MNRPLPGWMAGVILIILAAAWLIFNLRQPPAQHITAVKPAAQRLEGINRRPDFTLKDLDGKPHTLSHWQGKVIILNFWASWCPPCRHEIPLLKQLQQQYGERGLQIIGIAIDQPDRVRNFLIRTPVNYPVVAGEDDAMRVAIEYGNFDGVLPYNVIIDRDGMIHTIQLGELDRSETEAIIASLLTTKPNKSPRQIPAKMS